MSAAGPEAALITLASLSCVALWLILVEVWMIHALLVDQRKSK